MKEKQAFRLKRLQLGLGMLEIMLLVFALSGVLIVGTLALRTKSVSLAAQSQAQVLAAADKALVSFAILNNRLPCPDTNNDGYEDCGSGAQKGWLPHHTLRLEGAINNAQAGQLRYMVQRAAADLAVAEDLWQPIKSGFTGAYSETRTFAPINIGIPDLCLKLANAAGIALQSGHAQVASTPPRAVAYAVAHPGSKDEDGDGSLFDAENASATGNVAAPAERDTQNSVYDDRVLERQYTGLAQQLDCAQLNTSINMVSLAAEAVDQVHSQAITNTVLASVLTVVNGVLSAIAAVKTILAITKLATSIGYASTAAGLLSAAIAGCAVVVGCAEIPHAVASVAAAAVSVTASSAAVVASAITAALQITATGLTLSAAIVAGVSTASNFDLSAAVAQSLAEKNKATASKNAAYSAWQSAIATESGISSNSSNATSNIYATARNTVAAANAAGVPAGNRSIYELDVYVDALNSQAYNWYVAESNYATANDAYVRARDATSGGGGTTNTDSTAALNALQGQIDAETDPVKKQGLIDAKATLVNSTNNASNNAQQVSQINAQIAELDAQIATNPSNVTDLQALRLKLVSQLSNLTQDVASALAYKNSRDAARVTAKTNYINARNALVNATQIPYSVTTCTTSGSPPVESCTTAYATYDGRPAMRTAIGQSFDDTSARPDRGVFFKLLLQQQQTAASQSAYNSALDTETQATSAYNSLVALSTGSTPSGTYVTPWNGADAILKEADKKGGVR